MAKKKRECYKEMSFVLKIGYISVCNRTITTQRNVNSKYTSLPPERKKSSFMAMIEKGSLKLRLMRELTAPGNGIPASQNWKDSVCEEHERKMVSLLSAACGWVVRYGTVSTDCSTLSLV